MPNQRVFKPGHEPEKIRAEIFVQDPLVAETEGFGIGVMKIEVEGEPFLGAGPTTRRISVLDYNADLDVIFAPATPLARNVSKGVAGFAVGGADRRKNFRFHQVNVWAVITKTLEILETPRVFGRRIPWAFPGGRLTVLPHAGYWENAFYDRDSAALHFFYFEGITGPVFTCLSHDIVSHELGHAVLDGLKPYYNEIDSRYSGGFHEYFGDAVAMVAALNIEDVIRSVAREKPRALSSPNVIADIGWEFGNALGGDGALRSARKRFTMADLAGVEEEHDVSRVLSYAFYRLLQKLYVERLEVARRARSKSKIDGQVAYHALVSAARITSRMMLAALDYCPPAGITYLEYARAVIRADEVSYPLDEQGYRALAKDIFLDLGIANGERETSPRRRIRNSDLRRYDLETLSGTATDAYEFLDANRETLEIPRDVNFELSNLYRTRKVSSGGYYPPREVVLEFVWTEDVLLTGTRFGDLEGERFPLYCGGTLVFDADGNVLHYVLQDCTDERKADLENHVAYLVEAGAFDEAQDELGLGGRGGENRVGFQVVDGRVRATRNPALRHEGRRR